MLGNNIVDVLEAERDQKQTDGGSRLREEAHALMWQSINSSSTAQMDECAQVPSKKAAPEKPPYIPGNPGDPPGTPPYILGYPRKPTPPSDKLPTPFDAGKECEQLIKLADASLHRDGVALDKDGHPNWDNFYALRGRLERLWDKPALVGAVAEYLEKNISKPGSSVNVEIVREKGTILQIKFHADPKDNSAKQREVSYP